MNEESGAQKIGVAISGGHITVSGDIVGRDKNVYEAPVPVIAALHQLPPPPGDFTGRENELRELRVVIGQGGVHIAGFQGQGGVGKTALALRLAAELTPKFPDAQIYLDLKGVNEKPLAATAALSHVLRSFRPEAKLPENEDDLRALFHSFLHDKRALLLMDNAKDTSQLKSLIPPEGCILLVTSRYRFTLPGLHQKYLDTLPPKDATDLLLRIAPRIDGEAEAIAKLCGYLPLALRLAASVIAVRVDVEPMYYRKQLAEEKTRLRSLASEEESVTASIASSYNLLDDRLQEQWRMLAVFPDTFDATAAAAVWDVEVVAGKESLSRLVQCSMIEWNESTKRYRMHDLMHDFAHQQLTSAESDVASRRHAKRYGIVLAAANATYRKGGESIASGLALFDLEWANIQTAQMWAGLNAEHDNEAAKLCSDYCDWGSSILAVRQHPPDRPSWIESALAASRHLGDRAAEGIHLGNLGIALKNLGNYSRAVECHEQRLTIARELGDRNGENAALANLGGVYSAAGDNRRAIGYLEKVLEMSRVLGDRRGEGYTLGNLGAAHYALGDFRHAIEYQEQHLAISREIGDKRGEGNALGALGMAYLEFGDAGRAIEYQDQHLNLARQIGHRLGESNALGNLGVVHAKLGEKRRAINYYEQKLEIARDIHDRYGEGIALWNISMAFNELGDKKSAIEHAEDALKVLEQIKHPTAEIVRKRIAQWRKI
jgi:tetratricopeptide (TPR) repeat protein